LGAKFWDEKDWKLEVELDQLLGAQGHKYPVHVYARHAQGVGKLILSYGQFVGVPVGKPDSPQAKQHLAQKMRDALLGRTGANIDEPLAQGRFVHERSPPERSRKRWLSVISNTRWRGIPTTLQGDNVPTVWSIAFRMKLCRSQKSPGIRYATM
jgi:hypothetical protein